jgi:hypothetical protein
VAYNFQTGNNKIKLLMEYEGVTQKVLFRNVVLAALMHFPGRWVGRDGPIPWPPRSPNITPLDFFLWGYVKDIVYKTPLTSLNELKLRIVAAIETVTPQMLENTWREIEYCLDILCATKGVHVEVV